MDWTMSALIAHLNSTGCKLNWIGYSLKRDWKGQRRRTKNNCENMKREITSTRCWCCLLPLLHKTKMKQFRYTWIEARQAKKKKKSRGVVEVTSNKHDYTERKLDHIVAILNEAIIEWHRRIKRLNCVLWFSLLLLWILLFVDNWQYS